MMVFGLSKVCSVICKTSGYFRLFRFCVISRSSLATKNEKGLSDMCVTCTLDGSG